MNNPELYNTFNQLQFRDAEKAVDLFRNRIVQTEKKVNLIDLGTGCGDVLINVILKKLGLRFNSVVGVDISNEMLEYARKKYIKERIQFEVIDIESDFMEKETSFIVPDSFDIVTSFYCLNWIRDQNKAFSNIHRLLVSGGYFICVFVKSHIIFDAYKELSKITKYVGYMYDAKNCISNFCDIENPIAILEKMLKEIGFNCVIVQHTKDTFDYETETRFRESMKAISTFAKRFTAELLEDFYNDLAKFLADYNIKNNNSNLWNCPYEIITLIIQKQ